MRRLAASSGENPRSRKTLPDELCAFFSFTAASHVRVAALKASGQFTRTSFEGEDYDRGRVAENGSQSTGGVRRRAYGSLGLRVGGKISATLSPPGQRWAMGKFTRDIVGTAVLHW